MPNPVCTRRNFLIGSSLALASALSIGSAKFEKQNEELLILENKLSFSALPLAFNGFRIALLSDIHLSAWMPEQFLEKIVSKTNQLKADLILLAGDYIWHHDKWLEYVLPEASNRSVLDTSYRERPGFLYQRCAKFLSQLTAPQGVYAVLGNHDHWIEVGLCKEALAQNSINLLINREVEIRRGSEKISLYGADDYWTGIPLAPRSSFDQNKNFRIILTHNPDFFAELVDTENVTFNLGLAGHTHGGQIKLPLLGAPTFNISDTRFAEGICTLQEGLLQTVTSRGLGAVELPFRINCPPEINLITLARS